MTVAVVVPWRPTPDRLPAWHFVDQRWQSTHREWRLVTCDHGGEWAKGEAVAFGVRATFEDVLVIADADVWCDGVTQAVDAVRSGSAWAVPHARILRLDRDSTARVLAGEPLAPTLPLERPIHRAVSGGGITVMRRDVFDACPMPVMGRREDEIWQTHLTRMFGRPWRGTADLYHLWHEREVSDG